jgi:hypothetical protein
VSTLRRFGLILAALIAALIFGCGGGGPSRSAGLVYQTPTVTTDAQGNQTVSVGVLAWNGIAKIRPIRCPPRLRLPFRPS